MKFTKIPENTFKELQLNAGIIATSFNPVTGVVNGLLGATSGGTNFTATGTFSDYGDDIDNCPKNMKELKKQDSVEVTMAGTFATLNVATAKMLMATADVDSQDSIHIIPRKDILETDFLDIWWVGDYSDKNGEENGGFIAIHLMNSLNTGGFSLQSSDKAKGKFAFSFTGHFSMDAQNKVPYEMYIKEGISEATVTVAPEAGTTELFDHLVSEMQTGVTVSDDAITGTLYFIEGGLSPSGYLSGDGNFLALKFTADWDKFTSVKVGLDPSQSSGLVELINDPDKNGVFKVTSNTQKFKVVATSAEGVTTKEYSLAGLTLETE